VSQEEPDEDLEGELDVEGDQAEAAEVPRRGRRRTKAEEILATLPSSGIVAVVGRPNVGKSTLFNRLVGKKTAIVHDEPGVTRDRHYGDVLSRGRRYTVVDTGGFDPESEDPMRQGIKRQIDIAIAEADLIVCVLDATLPPTGADYAEIDLLRRSEKPVIYVANKADSAYGDRESNELYRLGIERVIAISALHGRRLDELEAAIDAALPKDRAEPVPVLDGLIRVALVGRPNAGKSSLVNRLAGEERSLVDARPGTTRDPVDTVIEQRGKRYVLIDTAGIRRKAKVAKEDSVVEAVSVLHAIRAMERATSWCSCATRRTACPSKTRRSSGSPRSAAGPSSSCSTRSICVTKRPSRRSSRTPRTNSPSCPGPPCCGSARRPDGACPRCSTPSIA
jgi:small GTP-binding protein